jgi:hypothetical protein
MVPGEWEEQDSRCAARNCAAGEKGLQMTTVTQTVQQATRLSLKLPSG